MRIVHITLATGYIDNMAYQENVLPKMHKLLGHQVEIITSPYTKDKSWNTVRHAEERFYSEGVPVVVLQNRFDFGLFKYLKYFNGLYEELTRFSPDIMFVHSPQFLGNRDIVKYKKKHPSVKLFCDNHSDYINSPSKPIKYTIINRIIPQYAIRKMIEPTDFFWGVTPLRVRYLQEVYKVPARKTGLLVMGGDDTLIHADQKVTLRRQNCLKWGIPEDATIIITGGKMSSGKNLKNLLDAFAQLCRDNLHLVVYGNFPPDMEHMKERCTSMQNVHLAGWLNPEETYNALLSSDLAIYPGTHSVLWEQTVACGIPAIFRWWDDMQHVDVNGNCVFLKTGTAEDIRTTLQQCMQIGTYEKMKAAAGEAANHFLYSNIAKKAILGD